jgi:hypothetical protein
VESVDSFRSGRNAVRIYDYLGLQAAIGKDCRLICYRRLFLSVCFITSGQDGTLKFLLLQEFTNPDYEWGLACSADGYVAYAYDRDISGVYFQAPF